MWHYLELQAYLHESYGPRPKHAYVTLWYTITCMLGKMAVACVLEVPREVSKITPRFCTSCREASHFRIAWRPAGC
jgi:hypothetical protein